MCQTIIVNIFDLIGGSSKQILIHWLESSRVLSTSFELRVLVGLYSTKQSLRNIYFFYILIMVNCG